MTEWTYLRHAYGAADDIPGLLAQLSPDQSAPVWEELWSRLCHQGSVYSASFAALSYLLKAAETWAPSDRAMVLALAAAIVASDDVAGSRADFLRGQESVVASLAAAARDAAAAPGLSVTDLIYVLQAVLAFEGDRFWGGQLDRLASGEFEGQCPTCQAELYVVVGQYGFFTTSEEWVNRPGTTRAPIVPTEPGSLTGAGRWLDQQAARSSQPLVSRWIQHLFGMSSCPSCSRQFRIEESIRQACGPIGC